MHVEGTGENGEWGKEACDEFAKNCSNQVLKMVAGDESQEDSILRVVLFVTSPTLDLCINALLVKNNLAVSTGPLLVTFFYDLKLKIGFVKGFAPLTHISK